MTGDTMPFLDALLERGGGDFMKSLAEEVLARLMAFDVEGQIGAARFERSEARTTQRNGYRPRAFDTRRGTLELKIPKLRKGSYFPSWSRAARPSRRSWRCSRRCGTRGCRPARWTTSCRPWA